MSSAAKAIEPTRNKWKTVRLKDVCQFKPPKSIPRKALNEGSLVSFVPMGDLGELTKHFETPSTRKFGEVVKGYTYFADGDVLCAKITPCFENGKLGIARNLENGVGFGSSEFVVMRSKGELLPEFLYYYLSRNEFREAGKAIMSGAVGHKRVPKGYFENLEISLPPLAEQKRIVAVLDQAFAALDRARALAETNLADAESLFPAAIGDRIASAFETFGPTTLEQLSEHITDGDHQAPPKVDTGVPFITISNIEKSSRRIDFTKTFYVPRTYYEKLSSKRRPNCGDILYSVTGSFGIPVLVENYTEFCFQRHIGLIRPNEYTNSDWLHFMLMSPQCFEQADAAATGTAQRTVSLKALRALQVPDTPPQEQSRIASEISELYGVCFERVAQYELKLKGLEKLRRSVLNTAFSGQLS